MLRIDDRKAGRELLRRASAVVTSAATTEERALDAGINVALTFQGLRALGVPQDSLDSFSPEFQRGMAARAADLGDTGESGPQQWETPLGTADVHIVLYALQPDAERLAAAIARAREVHQLPGITPVWRQDCYSLPTETEHFGFRDGVGHPAIEGSGVPGSNPLEPPLKAGEFVLGYPDEMNNCLSPQPAILGRNGTYVAFRKLHQRVAAFRQYLQDNAGSPDDEELLAAKMMGRWRSGAPLALTPSMTIRRWALTPSGATRSSIRRMTRRPQDPHRIAHSPSQPARCGRGGGHPTAPHDPARHRVWPAPAGRRPRGRRARPRHMFAFLGAHLGRQFEFVQTQWMNAGVFFGAGDAKDPIAGPTTARRLHHPAASGPSAPAGLPRFVITRGGEYAFMPGLRALRWLADLNT